MHRKVITFFLSVSCGVALSAALPDPNLFDGSRSSSSSSGGGQSGQAGESASTAQNSTGEGSATGGAKSEGSAEKKTAGGTSEATGEKTAANGTEKKADSTTSAPRDFGNTKVGSAQEKKIPEESSKETVDDILDRRFGEYKHRNDGDASTDQEKKKDSAASSDGKKDNSAQDNTKGGTIPAGI